MPNYTGISYPIYLIVGAVCLTAAWLRRRLQSVTAGALGRPPSVTVLVPAFNEEDGLGDTLTSLSLQTYPDLRVVVVDDCSTDATADVARSFPGTTVVCPPQNLGSKARAQNFGLSSCGGDLVLPVDADTLLEPTYIEKIVRPFEDARVAIAAGCVLTRYTNAAWERGRSIEYLFGFHFQRPIQNSANAPVVCSGCCSAFRREWLVQQGGFPERTIVEDMDYTWTQQIRGYRAVYVGGAVAYAADPDSLPFLRKQVKRWMAGFFQNVRIHARTLVRHKPMLALWVFLACFEILTAPLWYATPLIATQVFGASWSDAMEWWMLVELSLVLPPLVYGSLRRDLPFWQILGNVPFVYLNKLVNFTYAWRGILLELTPLRHRHSLVDYEKGRG
jgi:cellulose synthase/poly-beta-1,6-N-acetylglucosamine synthase-like glycosyltransferase